MRKWIIFFFGLFVFASSGKSQTDYRLLLRSGLVVPEANHKFDSICFSSSNCSQGYAFLLVQFTSIPDASQRKKLENFGVHFLQYIPKNAYILAIPSSIGSDIFKTEQIRTVIHLNAVQKTSPLLCSAELPAYAFADDSHLKVILSVYSILNLKSIAMECQDEKFIVTKMDEYSHRLYLIIPREKIFFLASKAYTSYLEPIDPPSLPENLTNRTDHRSNAISTDFASGFHFNGNGVKVAQGDDGKIGPHIDYTGRVNMQNVTNNLGNHGDHVAGILMGAGNLDPVERGMAWGADLYMYSVFKGVDSAATLYSNPGIRITSTSYGDGCNSGYTSFAQTVDKQVYENPSLLHVFSAGNSGTSNCGYGAGANWGNITGGVKLGKNVFAIANLDDKDVLDPSSSRGPASDGRIKPELCAVGTDVRSTVDTNRYEVKTGTSMACPGVSGTLAQLFEAFQIMNGNTEPEAALLRTLLMNTADDLGNPGPDFKTGFGRINAYRAVKALEENRYLSATIDQGQVNNHSITIPSGTKQVKVMIGWIDPQASVATTHALVNDLNMTLTDPSSNIFNPLVLNPSPNASTLNDNAVQGIDTLNNMEQIVIDMPLAGSYQIQVNGFEVPMGPQTYYICWEFLSDAITLTYPIGGESFVPGETETIRWDAFDATAVFSLQYSIDNGSTWNSISTSLPSTNRFFDWLVPDSVTGNALVKIVRGSESDSSDAPFSIIRVPQQLMINWACRDSLQITWHSVPNADRYEVSMLGNKYMDSLATVSDTSLLIYSIDTTVSIWYSVKARAGANLIGRRGIAIEKKPGSYACPLSVQEAEIPENEIQVYPNPSTGEVNVISDNLFGAELSLQDIQGRTLLFKDKSFHDFGRCTLNLRSFASGIYVLKIRVNEKTYFRKLAKL